MFTIHYDSSQEELDEIQVGDTVGYGFGGSSVVVKILKQQERPKSLYYEFHFEDGHVRGLIVLPYASRKQA